MKAFKCDMCKKYFEGSPQILNIGTSPEKNSSEFLNDNIISFELCKDCFNHTVNFIKKSTKNGS